MKIIVLDDSRSRRKQVAEMLQKKRHEVTSCYASNEFIAALDKNSSEMVMLDLESWNRGGAIYTYFKIPQKLENLPILFYNAPSNFSILKDRPRHPRDRILFKPTDVETIANNLPDNR